MFTLAINLKKKNLETDIISEEEIDIFRMEHSKEGKGSVNLNVGATRAQTIGDQSFPKQHIIEGTFKIELLLIQRTAYKTMQLSQNSNTLGG
jgi:hypothetical protein